MSIGLVVSVSGQPDAGLSAAAEVVVEERMMAPARFALVYPADIADGDLPLLRDARMDAGSTLMIVADSADGPVCLIKGPVHGQRIVLARGGEGSSLEVRGSDTSIAMDRETRAVVWADLTDADVASTVLAGYGYVPDVESTAGRHMSTKHTLVQRSSDLRFVSRLARRNGASFWISCNPLGIETAHVRRPDTAQPPGAELNPNAEPATVGTVDLEWDIEIPTSATASGVDPASRNVLSGDVTRSPLSPLGNEDAATISPETRSTHLAPAVDDAGDLTARAEGTLIEAGWFVRVRCTTSAPPLTRIVRAHSVLTLAGIGSRHSGSYYVAGVRHRIDAEAHRMELTLVRNAWGSDDTRL